MPPGLNATKWQLTQVAIIRVIVASNDIVENVTPVGQSGLWDPGSVGLNLDDVKMEKHSQSGPTERDEHIDCCPLPGQDQAFFTFLVAAESEEGEDG